MNVKNILKWLAVYIVLVAMLSPAVEAQNNQREWEAFVRKFLPEEINDPEEMQMVIADMATKALVGPQFSEKFDLRNAFAAFKDGRLIPDKQNFFATKPQGDPNVPVEERIYTQGQPTGDSAASMLRVNPGEGALKYLNRGREPDPMGEELKLPTAEALKMVREMAAMVGIPPGEIAQSRALEGFVAGAPNDVRRAAEKPMRKRMEVLVTMLRCMPVEGSALKGCVPVFNSGLRTSMVEDRLFGPVPNYFRSHWPDFRQSSFDTVKPKTQDEFLRDAAAVLDENAEFGSLQELRMFLAFAQNSELAGQVGNTHCPSQGEGEDDPGAQVKNAGVEPPPELMIARRFEPAVVVYAVPKDIPPDDQIKPEEQTVSTGVHVYSIGLTQSTTDCDPDDEPQ